MSPFHTLARLAAVLAALPALFIVAAFVDVAAAVRRPADPWLEAERSARAGRRDFATAPQRWFALAVLLLACTTLPACGGGDPEDDSADGRQTVQPPACAQQPEVCK